MQKSCHQTPEQGDAGEPRISFVTTKVSWGMGCIITDKDIQCWKYTYTCFVNVFTTSLKNRIFHALHVYDSKNIEV